MAVMLMSLAWTLGMLIWPRYIEPPIPGTLGLMLATVLARAAIGAAVYASKVLRLARVRRSGRCGHGPQLRGGQRCVGRAAGPPGALYRDRQGQSQETEAVATPESLWAIGLMLAAIATLAQNGLDAPAPLCWALAQFVMALPHLAAVWLSMAPNGGPPAPMAGQGTEATATAPAPNEEVVARA